MLSPVDGAASDDEDFVEPEREAGIGRRVTPLGGGMGGSSRERSAGSARKKKACSNADEESKCSRLNTKKRDRGKKKENQTGKQVKMVET